MQPSNCYILYLKAQYELSNKYTEVSNLKSYIFQVKNILGIILFGVKIDPRKLIICKIFTVDSFDRKSLMKIPFNTV